MNRVPLPAYVAKMNSEEARKAAIPEELDSITDVVLSYRPKPKSKGAKRRVRRAKKAKADAQDR